MKNIYQSPSLLIVNIHADALLMMSAIQDNPTDEITVGNTVTNASLFETKSQGDYDVWGEDWSPADKNLK